MEPPPAMQKIGKEMEQIQDQVEVKLRPYLAKQFKCMGDAMNDQYASSQEIQTKLASCQKETAAIQAELDRALQNFSQSMQRGIETCQRQAQDSMSRGNSESAVQASFMQCAGSVAEGQLSNIPAVKMEIERILNNY